MLIADFKDQIGASRPDVENWTSRLELSSVYAETTPGVARRYSRENVIELAVIAAMTKVGCPLRTAAAFAAMVLRHDQVPGSGRAWIAAPSGDFTKAEYTNDPAGLDFEGIAARGSSPAVSLVHIGKIIAIVDDLFKAKGERPR